MENKENLTFGYTPKQYKKFTKYAWIYLIMFSVLYCCFYCMRLNITNASPLIIDGLGWDKSDIGILTSTLFWTYGIGHLINGRVSEIFGTDKFIIIAVLFSFAANICMGFSGTLVVMAVLWGINGFFQSMAWTPCLATLTNWWPGKKRGFAVGFASAFTGFGQVVATLMVTLTVIISKRIDWNSGIFASLGLTSSDSWRLAFIIPPLLPLLMLVLYIILVKPTPAKAGLPEYKEEDPESVAREAEMAELIKTKGKLYPYKHVLSNKKFLILVFVTFIVGVARYGLTTWTPLYFLESFDIDVESSLLGTLALPLGMAVGTFVVPWITDRACPTNRMPAIIISGALSAVTMLAFMFFNPTVTWQFIVIEILLFLAGFGIYAIDGISFTVATDVGGRVFSGTCSGILDSAEYMGAAIQSIVYGFVSEKLGWSWVFVTIGVLLMIIAVLGIINNKSAAKSK